MIGPAGAGRPAARTGSYARQTMNIEDLDRAEDVRRRRASRSAWRRSSRSSIRETLELAPRYEELRAPRSTEPGLREAVTGELISSEIEMISGPAREPERCDRASARAAGRPVRARRKARRSTGLDRHPPLGGLPPPADHRHRALPPRRGRPKYVAWRNNTFSLHVHVGVNGLDRAVKGLRPSASGAAVAARDLSQLALPRRARQRPALGAHAELHQELPALRHPGPVRRLGRVSRATSNS